MNAQPSPVDPLLSGTDSAQGLGVAARSSRGPRGWVVAGLVSVGLAAVAAALLWNRPVPPPPAEAELSKLVRIDGRLRINGSDRPFTGILVERYPDGAIRSRSGIQDGLLHGVSQGFHTNGILQVRESFRQGVSEGLREKWFASGAKESEAHIVGGELNGVFRRWHENGALAEELPMLQGQPEGTCWAFYPSGFVKAKATLRSGSPVERAEWPDGQLRRTAPR